MGNYPQHAFSHPSTHPLAPTSSFRPGAQAGRQAGRQSDRQAGWQTGRHARKQAGRQTGRQAGRPGQAGRQAGPSVAGWWSGLVPWTLILTNVSHSGAKAKWRKYRFLIPRFGRILATVAHFTPIWSLQRGSSRGDQERGPLFLAIWADRSNFPFSFFRWLVAGGQGWRGLAGGLGWLGCWSGLSGLPGLSGLLAWWQGGMVAWWQGGMVAAWGRAIGFDRACMSRMLFCRKWSEMQRAISAPLLTEICSKAG